MVILGISATPILYGRSAMRAIGLGKTRMLRGFHGSLDATCYSWAKGSWLARPGITKGINAAGQEYSMLLLSDGNGLKQFEIERRLCREGDVAIAGQSRATRTRCGADQRTDGSAFASTSNGPDGRATSGATAHHGCCALAFSFAGHGGTGRLNLMILPVHRDARECEAQHGTTLETAGSFRFTHDSLGSGTLWDGNLSVDFNGRFDRRCEPVAGFIGFRAYGLIQDDGDHGIRRNDQRFRLDDLFHSCLCRVRHGRSGVVGVGVGAGLLISRLLTPCHQNNNGKGRQRNLSKTAIHQILPRAGNLYSLNIRSSVMKSICLRNVKTKNVSQCGTRC